MYDSDRLVEVKGLTEGSGYVVSSGLILTAGHVVIGAAGNEKARPPRVRVYGDYQREKGSARCGMQESVVIWPNEQFNADNDFALLKITEGHGPAVEPVVWSSLPSTGQLDVIGAGFPDASIFVNKLLSRVGLEIVRERDTRQVTGRVEAGSDLKQRLVYGAGTFEVVMAREDALVNGKQAWMGMSGAPLFAQGSLIGMVRSAAGVHDSHSLKALPVDRLFGQKEVCSVIQRHGLQSPVRGSPYSGRRLFNPTAFLHLLNRKVICDEISMKLDAWITESHKPLMLAIRGRQDDELDRLFRRLGEEELRRYGLQFIVKSIEWPRNVPGSVAQQILLRTIKSELIVDPMRTREPLKPEDVKSLIADSEKVLFIYTLISTSSLCGRAEQLELLEWWNSFWQLVSDTGVKVVVLGVFEDDFHPRDCCDNPLTQTCQGLACETNVELCLPQSWHRLSKPAAVYKNDLDPWLRRIRCLQPHLSDDLDGVETALSISFDKALPRSVRCVKFGLPTFLSKANAARE